MAKPLTPSQKAAVAAEKARQAAAAAKKNKPKPAPSAGRRVNPKAAKPKPAPKPAARPALPPGRPGGALATRPPTQSTRQANARAQLRDASRGSTGPNRVGQPAGSANRMYGANVVNNSVNRAVAATRLANLSKAAGGVALPAAIAAQAMNVVGGFQKLANHPFLKGKGGKPTPSAGRRTNPNAAKPAKPKPQRQGPPVPARLQQAPKPPVLPAPVRTVAARPSTPARPTTPSRRPAPKPPAASSAPKAPKVAQTSGIGPVKSGAAYASKKGSISESVRQLREMRAASVRRQTGQAAPALSSSKDYSSQFKDMKGGSSRFAAELKKKKKKLF
jgi:hypothetical protein